MSQQKLLLVYPHYSSFVKTDAEILSSRYKVIPYHFKPARGAMAVVTALIRQFFFLALHIRKFSLVYIWFADQHSLLPVLFARLTGRRSYLVIGGYDVCRIKALNYGVFCSKLRGWAAIISMKQSTLNLAVSHHVARKVKAFTRQSNLALVYNCVSLPGYQTEEFRGGPPEALVLPAEKRSFPEPDGKTTPAPGGKVTPDPEGKVTPGPEGKVTPGPEGKVTPGPEGKVTPGPEGKVTPDPEGTAPQARKMVLTVAKVDSERTFRLKGLDTFIEVAGLLPEISFCIAGFGGEKPAWLSIPLPPNLMVTGDLPHDQLPQYYLQSLIYCQFSRSESFGIALAEAIHYGCLPLITRVGGMPEIVRDDTLTVDRNPRLIADKISRLFTTPHPSPSLLPWFSVAHRTQRLLQLLTDVKAASGLTP